MKKEEVEIINRTVHLEGFFHIEEVTLRHRRLDGRLSPPLKRLNLDRGAAAAVVLFNPEKRTVTLVRQFRYPTCEHGPGRLLELVAGTVTSGADAERVARDEIREEAGYDVAAVEFVSAFYLTPGGSSERIFLYYAEVTDSCRVSSGGGLESEGEDIEVVELPANDIFLQMADGEIQDAKTLVGLMWLQDRLRSS